MPAVPLGVEAYARIASSQPEVRLVNLYMEEDKSGASPDQYMRLQRPGMTRNHVFAAPVRALYQSDNSISSATIAVVGDKLVAFDGSTETVFGTVENDGSTARIAATFERVGVVSSGSFYVYDGDTISLVQLRDKENPDDPGLTLTDLDPIVDVEVLNGYFVLVTQTGTFYWLVPGEKTVNPLNYATAEALPDGCVGVRRLRDDLMFYGSDSIEVWQATGDSDATFSRAAGRLIDRGCSSRDSIAVFDNSLMWVADDGIVYRLATVPERVSTFGIEDRIKRATDLCSAFVFTTLGHKFYVLRIPGEGVFAYDAATQLWCEFQWSAMLGIDTARGAVVADGTGKLFRLDPDSSLDDGVPFLRLVTGSVPLPATPVANASLAIGVGSDDLAILSLRWHDPRRGWSTPVELLARGEGDILNAWRLGMARAPSRTYEISTVSPAVVRISGAVANEGWRV